MEENKVGSLLEQSPKEKKAWMLTWSPDKNQWDDIEKACADIHNGLLHETEWRITYSGAHPCKEDDIFLMRVGKPPLGIVAHGRVKDVLEEKRILVEFDWIQARPDLKPDAQFLQKTWNNDYPDQQWSDKFGRSGWEIEDPARTALLEAWGNTYTPVQGAKMISREEEEKAVSSFVDHNLILCGPPGTGKTYSTVIYAVDIIKGKSEDEIKADLQNKNLRYDDFLKKYEILRDAGHIAFTTFHQSYGYEEFIEGIKPVMENKVLQYQIEDGVFKRFCKAAEKAEAEAKQEAASEEAGKDIESEKMKKLPFVFIIDEINRGNISKIFGELITLIEDSKRAGAAEAMAATLPYSQESFSVPQNVYIIGTMNTADRSIAMMDTALRRRFSFVEMVPDTSLLNFDVARVNIKAMLDAINERITYLYDREHTIGHAFFMGLEKHRDIEHLSAIFMKKVIPLLQEYFYDDYEKIQLVLGDNAKKNKLKFIQDTVKQPAGVFRKATALDDYDEKTLFTINEDAFGNPESYQQIYKEPEAQTAATQSATAETTDAAKDDAE